MPVERLVWREIDALARQVERLGELTQDGDVTVEMVEKIREELWRAHFNLIHFFGDMYPYKEIAQKYPITLTVFREDDTIEKSVIAYTEAEAKEKARRLARAIQRKDKEDKIRIEVTWMGPGEDASTEEAEAAEEEDNG